MWDTCTSYFGPKKLQGLDQQGRRQQDNNLQNSQNSAYEGADSLRNQANKMFAR